MQFELLHSTEINRKAWNTLVQKSQLGSLYLTYEYLSTCGMEWEALVGIQANDYLCAMIFPYRKIYSIKYIYQSPHVPYLNPLVNQPHSEFEERWLTHLKKFRYVAKLFMTTSGIVPENFKISRHHGFQIPLNRSYQELASNFTGYRLRRLNKAYRSEMSAERTDDANVFFAMHEKFTLPKITTVNKNQHDILIELWNVLLRSNMAEIWEARHNGECVASFLLGKFNDKIYYLASASSEEGRKLNAISLLIDQQLKEYTQKEYTSFDLGNAGISGIDRFKSSFGAEPYPITQLYKNDLPWYIRIPKRIVNLAGIALTSGQK